MQRITVSTLGFDLTREVPSSTDEYNSLAPKRNNPVLEDAIDNILYRNTFAAFRSTFLDKLEEATGVKRINHGTEDEPQWESDARFLKRLIAETVKATGKTEPALRAEWLPVAQAAMDAAPFNPAERESTSSGPAIGKRDLANAAQMFKDGKADAVAAKLTALLNRPVDVTSGDADTNTKSLARALADYRRMIAAQAEAGLTA